MGVRQKNRFVLSLQESTVQYNICKLALGIKRAQTLQTILNSLDHNRVNAALLDQGRLLK
jgi:hypothetical protein